MINPTNLSRSIGNLGDIDGNGFEDIVVGTTFQGGTIARGQVRVLLMENNFIIKSNIVWDSLLNGIPAYQRGTDFGVGLIGLGDVNKDGKLDAIVGLPSDYKDHNLYGAMYVLFLDGKQYPQTIQTNQNDLHFKAYPNPIRSGNTINLELPYNFFSQALSISMSTPLGQKISSQKYHGEGNTIHIENSNLSSGLYILTIATENQNYFTTIIIE